MVAGHVESNFIRIPDEEQQTETSIASNKSLDKYETGFMTKPPKSSLLQQVKIKDDFRVQEKAHELHSILKRSPRLIMTTRAGKSDDCAPKMDFSEELSMKQEPVDDTIDNIIQFLDFESKSPGTSKVNKSGIDRSIKMNNRNKNVNSPAKKGNGQKQPHTVTNKDVENMRKLLNDTLERTSPKKKSSGDCKNTRRQSGDICLDKVVESEKKSQNSASKQVKGSLKHPLTENSSDVACKKIKLETDKDKLQVLGSVQAMEITTCSDSSDLELIESQPPPFIDLTSPVVDLTESPSPIRIVRTVTGYVVEKSCKTKLIVDTDSGMKLKKSNTSSRLYDDNLKASNSKSKAKTSSQEETKVKCTEKLKYDSKNEDKSGTRNIKQSINMEKYTEELENSRESSALNLKKTDKSVDKCKTGLENKEKLREIRALESSKTDKGCEKSKLSEGGKTNSKNDKGSDLKKKNTSIETSKYQSENKELSEVKTASDLKKKEKSNIAFSLGSIVSEMRKNERSVEKDKIPLDNKENANTIVKPVVKNRNKSPKNLQMELELNSDSGEKIDDKNRADNSNFGMKVVTNSVEILEENHQTVKGKQNIDIKQKIHDKSKVVKEPSDMTTSNKVDKQQGQVNISTHNENKEKSSNKSLSTSERHKHKDSSLTADNSHERDYRKSSSKSKSEELSKKTRWDIVMKDLDYDTKNRVSRKRKDSESDSDARSSRKGSPPVMYVSGKKSKR